MTTNFTFTKAEKRRAKLRLALDGPSGSGKTWTALTTAEAIAAGGRVAVIDTEHGSASLYADRFDFDVVELNGDFNPARYIQAMRAAEQSGAHTVIVIDSLSHAWEAEGGVMEIADRNKKGTNSWSGWAAATPAYRSLVDAILKSPLHVIATMRTKTEWSTDEKNRPVKIGTVPVMRQGIDFEFTVVGDLDTEHVMRISKTRCPAVADKSYRHPDGEFGRTLLDWLNDGGTPVPEAPPVWMERYAQACDQVGEDQVKALMKGSAPDLLQVDAAWERLQDLMEKATSSPDAPSSGTPQEADPAGEQADAPAPANGGVDASNTPTPPDTRRITQPQVRRLFALAEAAGLTEDEWRPIALHIAGVESRKDIQRQHVDAIVEAFREAGSAKTLAANAAAGRVPGPPDDGQEDDDILGGAEALGEEAA